MTSKLNIILMGSLVSATAATLVYVFTSFVTVAANTQADDKQDILNDARYLAIDAYHKVVELSQEEFSASIYYDQYYRLLRDYNAALVASQGAYAEELSRQMERVKAKICKADPSWERCDE